MATKDKQKAEAQEAEAREEQAPEPPQIADQIVVLNPDTGLGGYAFDEKFEAVPGQPYALTEEQYRHYSKVKHNSMQVIVKA